MSSNYVPTAKDIAHRQEVQKLKSLLCKQRQEIAQLTKELNQANENLRIIKALYNEVLKTYNLKGEQFEKYVKDTQALCNLLKLIGLLKE